MEKKRGNILFAAMDTVSACMKPVIPVLMGCGIIKLLMLLIALTGVFSRLGETEALLTAIDSAPFYFLPLLLAWSSSKHFGCDPALAMASVAVMLFPDFLALTGGETPAVAFGIPVLKVNYAYGVLPVIMLTFCLSHVQRFFEARIPESVRGLFAPAAVILVCGVLGVMLIGPVLSLAFGAVSGFIGWLQTDYPVAAWMVMGACLPLLVMTGAHWIFVTILLTQLGETGVESGFHVSCFFMSMTLTGSCLAVFLKSRGETRKAALSAGLTAFATGTSEPALFGVMLPLKTPLVAVMLSGALAGIWQGTRTLHSYVYAFPGIFSFMMFSSPAEPGNLAGVLIGGAIALAASFPITWLLYRPARDAAE